VQLFLSTLPALFSDTNACTCTLPEHLLRSILKYAGCSEETFILALIYMDQVVQFNPDFVISSLNVHRLLITSIMVRKHCTLLSIHSIPVPLCLAACSHATTI